jgi:hypothetical protein
MQLYTDRHKEKIKNLYNTIPWYGNRSQYTFHLDQIISIEDLLLDLKPTTVLDYGSGNGVAVDKLETLFPHIRFTRYDPFVIKYATKPTGHYDLVISHRVMRSVEMEYKKLVLEDMYNYASKYLLIEILLYDVDNIPYTFYDNILSAYNILNKGSGDPILRQGSDGVDHYITNVGYLISK